MINATSAKGCFPFFFVIFFSQWFFNRYFLAWYDLFPWWGWWFSLSSENTVAELDKSWCAKPSRNPHLASRKERLFSVWPNTPDVVFHITSYNSIVFPSKGNSKQASSFRKKWGIRTSFFAGHLIRLLANDSLQILEENRGTRANPLKTAINRLRGRQ